MNARENPSKLWAFLCGDQDGDAFFVVAEDKPIAYPLPDDATKPDEYVLATELAKAKREIDSLRQRLALMSSACSAIARADDGNTASRLEHEARKKDDELRERAKEEG